MAAALSALASVAVVEAAILKSEMKNNLGATDPMQSPVKTKQRVQNAADEEGEEEKLVTFFFLSETNTKLEKNVDDFSRK